MNRGRNVSGGLFIIFLGILFLLNNFGIIGWDIWAAFFDLWPLLLIAAGLKMMFRRNIFVQVIVVILIFVVPLAYYLAGGGRWVRQWVNMAGEYEKYNWSLPRDQMITEGILDLRFGAGEVDIGATSDHLISVAAHTSRNPEISQSVSDSKQKVRVEQKAGPQLWFGRPIEDWQVDLGEDILWEINLNSGASSTELDLRGIRFNKLSVESGVGDTRIIVGNLEQNAEIKGNSGTGSITITVPEDIGIKAELNTGVGGKELSKRDWIQDGNTYTTGNYQTAKAKLIIDLDVGVGRIAIN